MLAELFSGKNAPLIGLDISGSAVKMVEVASPGKGTYRIERYAIELLPAESVVDGNIANVDAVAEVVRRCHKKLATRTRNVAMALPSAAVITKRIICPAGLREDELEAQVESEANQYIPFSLDEVNLDFRVLGASGTDGNEVEVLLAASRKEKVEDRIAVAESAGLRTMVMDVESYAMQLAFELVRTKLTHGKSEANVVSADIGSIDTKVTVFRDQEVVYQREQAFGGAHLNLEIQRHFGLSADEAETAKRTGSLPASYEAEVLRPFLENAALEVQRALQLFYSSTQYNSVDHIVVAGGCASLPGLNEAITAKTGVPSTIANPFAAMQIAQRVQLKRLVADAPALMIACGLAMRRFDA
ncbi:MAG: pilus assembly protein PilM [Burkholderiales bacterium]